MMDGFERVALRWERIFIGYVLFLLFWNWLVLDNPEIQFNRCLRDWPLAECQARKDAGAM